MNIENEDILKETKPRGITPAFSFLRTILSLSLFIFVDYWIFKSWSAVLLLVSVIVIHEFGHFIVMKIFGYQGIKMTFVPFMGAYVSGEADHFSKYKKIVLLLAGPLPGILIGMLLLFLHQQHTHQYYFLAALAFLLLNLFNLLPIGALDGGQAIETIFPGSSIIVETVFLILSFVALLCFLYLYKAWFIVVILWLLARRILSNHLTYRVRRELDEKRIAYDCSYDDLGDDHYAQIRDILVLNSKQLSKRFVPGEGSQHEGELVKYIEKILVPYYQHNLNKKQTLTFIVIYLLAFMLPAMQWAFFKGWL